MPRTGKCPNYAGCLLAYRNETITVPDDAAFVATGITDGLLAAPRREGARLATESIVITRDTVNHVRQSTPIEE